MAIQHSVYSLMTTFVTLQFSQLRTEQQLKLSLIQLTVSLQKLPTSHSNTSRLTATSTVTIV